MDARSTAPLQDSLRRNLEGIDARIQAARQRGAAAAAAVTLIVVTKSVEPALFPALAAAGARDVGENRVQQAQRRKPLSPSEWTWHGIGHLQRNKAAQALRVFDVFHALDSLRLAERLESLLAPQGRLWPVYLQVNAAQDEAKAGVEPEEALALLRATARLPHLQVRGFMTMARAGAPEGELRSTFRTLRQIRDDGLRLGVGEIRADGLSMGMSDDFEIAVEEGATVVRVGRAVFAGVSNRATDPTPARGGEGRGVEEHE